MVLLDILLIASVEFFCWYTAEYCSALRLQWGSSC